MFVHSTALSKYVPCLIRLCSKVKFRLAFSLNSVAKNNMANHLNFIESGVPGCYDVGEQLPPLVVLNLGL